MARPAKIPERGDVPAARVSLIPKDVENELVELVAALARQAARHDHERACTAASDATTCAAL